jgi:LmbE family N-acetylglucosaminyl deacetylase
VVTYDAENTARHRDHPHTARVAPAAFDLSGVAAKLYIKAHGRAYWARVIRVAA